MTEYIEREALCEILENWRNAHADVDDEHGCGLLEDVICEVDAQTAADVAPVVYGRWIPVHESEISGWNPEVAGIDPIGGYICSACKNEAIYDCNDKFVLSDYCPDCGARMDGGVTDETD